MKSNHPDFKKILKILSENEVKFIIVGGISAVLQGSPVTTFDLDILYQKSPENIKNLCAAFQELSAAFSTIEIESFKVSICPLHPAKDPSDSFQRFFFEMVG